MAHFQKLTIFFPMWNEQAYIRRALSAGHEICEELIEEGEIADYELLIIDDASTDATPLMAREAASKSSRVRVVHHPTNRKLGGCLKTGFSEASGDLILYTDTDLPFDLGELRKACRLMRIYDADIVSAYRHDRTTEGPKRAAYSFAYNWLIRFAFHAHLRDVNFAFKLCRSRIFEHVKLESEGSFVDAELMIRAARLGYRVIQFGVDYFPRATGVSTLSSPAVIKKILSEGFALRKSLRKLKPLPAEVLSLDPRGEGLPAAEVPDTHLDDSAEVHG